MMKLGGPPKFKMKKFTVDEFERCLGSIRGSVRYVSQSLFCSAANSEWR